MNNLYVSGFIITHSKIKINRKILPITLSGKIKEINIYNSYENRNFFFFLLSKFKIGFSSVSAGVYLYIKYIENKDIKTFKIQFNNNIFAIYTIERRAMVL